MPDDDDDRLSQPPPTVMLCDWAETVDGKLYLMGAGWSRIVANTRTSIAIAVLWHVPWDRANQPMSIALRIRGEDGSPLVSDNGAEVGVAGSMEVGRPPGTKRGAPLDAPISFKLANIAFPPGRYVVEFEVDDQVLAWVAFDAVEKGPQG